MLRAKAPAEFSRADHARAITLLRDGRHLAHDISAAAAAKRAGKGSRKKKAASAA